MHDIPIIIIDSAPASHETEMQGPTGDLVWFHGHSDDVARRYLNNADSAQRRT